MASTMKALVCMWAKIAKAPCVPTKTCQTPESRVGIVGAACKKSAGPLLDLIRHFPILNMYSGNPFHMPIPSMMKLLMVTAVVLPLTKPSYNAYCEEGDADLPETLLKACEEGNAISMKDDPSLVQLWDYTMALLSTHDVARFLESSAPSERDGYAIYDLEYTASPVANHSVQINLPIDMVKDLDAGIKGRDSLRDSAAAAVELAEEISLPRNRDLFHLIDIKVGALNLSSPKRAIFGDLATIHFALTKEAIDILGKKYDGEFIIELREAKRSVSGWSVSGQWLRWNRIPEALFADNELFFYEYCSRHSVVLPGIAAPDFDFFGIDHAEHSSAGLRGKVVLLLFWHGGSLVSGPGKMNSLRSMAKFQTYFMNHPDWDDKVVLVGLSTAGTVSNAKYQVGRTSRYLLSNRLGSSTQFWYRSFGHEKSNLYERFDLRFRTVPLMWRN